VPVSTADLAAQWAVERELAREGLDRSTVAADEMVVRMRTLEADVVTQLDEQLSALSVTARLTDPSAAAVRSAFVRLYDQGVVVQDEQLVRVCPRCAAVVQRDDIERAEAEAQVLTIALDSVEIDLLELELLPGVVAIAVPDGDPAAGTTLTVPLAGRDVPVIGTARVDAPVAVVPAHSESPPGVRLPPAISVLDVDGVVRAPGPLQGLSRYAARAAAAELLAAEGVVADTRPEVEEVERCRHCGTALVPLLQRQWFLRSGGLEVAVADAIREGAATVAPSDLRERLLAAAGDETLWCISGGPAGGHPLPASTCLDCGRLAVEVETSGTCGACMGTTEPESTTLDGTFVTIASLVDQLDAKTTLVVDHSSVAPFALRLAALALRLNGELPFAHLAVHPPAPLDGDDVSTRLFLLGAPADAVDDLEAMLRRPPVGGEDVMALATAVETAICEGAPGTAIAALTTVLATGVPEADRARVAEIAAPLVGTTR
jgi:valyl-tRNA synthetase